MQLNTLESRVVEESVAMLHEGQLSLPYVKYESNIDNQNENCRIPVIFAHGLGPKNPKTKSHKNDDWGKLVDDAVKELGVPSILYTARGHGDSDGWQDSALSDPDQFTWKRLADDMYEMSKYLNFSGIIASGSSMGSATALYAAILYPDLVKAVIMVRPPTAWSTRAERRNFLLNSVDSVKRGEAVDATNYHLVLAGTAYSDLPSYNTERHLYDSVKCPVLILTIQGDDSHPLSTAEMIHSLLPASTLHIAASKKEAMSTWKDIIANFVQNI